MENPGLKKHISTEPFLKVTHRRTATTAAYDPERQSWLYDLEDPNYFQDDPAPSVEGNSAQPMVRVKNDVPNYPKEWLDNDTIAPENDLLYDSYGEDDITREDRDANRIRTAATPTMVAPRTQGIGGGVVPPEPATIQQNVQTPPPMAGTPTAQPVSATNGADPILRLPEANDAADQRRITQQQQVGGGQKENPAYDEAQKRVGDQVQQRRSHPLHKSAEMYDVEHWDDDAYGPSGLRYFRDTDFRPARLTDDETSSIAYSDQPMFQIKEPSFDEWDSPGKHEPGEACETCYLKHGIRDVTRDDHWRAEIENPHEFKPFKSEPNERFSAALSARQTHPPHQAKELTYDFQDNLPSAHLGAFDRERGEWTYDVEDPNYFKDDPAPSYGSGQSHGLYAFKIDDPYETVPQSLESDGTVKPGLERWYNDHYRQNEDTRNEALNRQAHQAAWDYLHERPEGFSLADHYRQKGFDVYEDQSTGMARITEPWKPGVPGARSNPSNRAVISVHPDYYIEHDRRDDTADPETPGVGEWDASGSMFEPDDEPCSHCWVHDNELVTKRNHEYETGNAHPWRGLENPESVSRFGSVHQAHNDFTQGMSDLLDAQGTDGNWDWSPYMHGLYNGMALGAAIHDGPDTEPDYRDAPKHWREEAYEKNKNKHFEPVKTSALVDHRVDEEDNLRYFHDTKFRPDRAADNFTVQPMIDFKHVTPDHDFPEEMAEDVDMDQPGIHEPGNGCETCWLKNKNPHSDTYYHDDNDHKFKPFSGGGSERFSSVQHQAAMYDIGEDEEAGLRYFRDTNFRPENRGVVNYSDQPMFQLKHTVPDELDDLDVGASHNPSKEGCETCWLQHGRDLTENIDHRGNYGHLFKPFTRSVGERFSALVGNGVDEDDNLRFFTDTDFVPPDGNFADQPMIDFKPVLPEIEGQMDEPYVSDSKPFCETCWLQRGAQQLESRGAHYRYDSDHPFKPITRSVGERFSAAPGESDEDFWARMEREHPGQQLQTHPHTFLSPDSHSHDFFDDEDAPGDEDDLIPDNMSLRDHSRLVNSRIVQWDGTQRHPKYTTHLSREIRDSDGNRAFADEGHVIEHNTNHHGPVLPTADNPEPHVLQYPWSHTYYPAGQSDDEGLTKGYNTPDQAMEAVGQLSIWGPRHRIGQELLNSGYKYVGSELPYDPSVVLPHEAAMRREAAYDKQRGEFLYNIESDDPDYYLKDKPHSAWDATAQPMMKLKEGPYEGDYDTPPEEDAKGLLTTDPSWDDGYYHHHSYNGCQGCVDRNLESRHPDDELHDVGHFSQFNEAHEYDPVPDLAPGVRL